MTRFVLKEHFSDAINSRRIYDTKLDRWYYDMNFDTTYSRILEKICLRLNELNEETEIIDKPRFEIDMSEPRITVIDHFTSEVYDVLPETIIKLLIEFVPIDENDVEKTSPESAKQLRFTIDIYHGGDEPCQVIFDNKEYVAYDTEKLSSKTRNALVDLLNDLDSKKNKVQEASNEERRLC